ncbi:MAG TPA: AAA family ATPase [Phycisphaerae bacterium]|nr:AAA family ATPase [Phycisphaerae bacterium]
MYVEQLSLRNWRGQRDRRVCDFDEGLNLIVGPNESGKSTIFEALARAMFDRHTSKSREIAAVQPIGGGLAREVEVVFRDRGARYRLCKRFLVNPSAELFRAERDGWRRTHEGDRADQAVIALFDAQPPGGGASRPEHHGIAQALWYLQRDPPSPDAWSDGLRTRLGDLHSAGLSTPLRERVLAALESEYLEHFSEKRGQLRRSAELHRIEHEELPRLQEQLAAALERTRRVEAARQALEPLVERECRLAADLRAAQARGAQTRAALERLHEEEARRSTLESATEAAQRDLTRLNQVWDEWTQRNRELDRVERDLQAAFDQAAGHHAASTAQQQRAERARQQGQTLEQQRQALEAALAAAVARRRRRQLLDERGDLSQRLARLDALCSEQQAAEQSLAALNAPTESEWRELTALHEAIQVLRGQIAAGAVRVRFELAGNPDVRSDPPADFLPQTGEHVVTQPTRFDIGPLGRIEVRGGASLSELNARLARREAERDAHLRRYAAPALEALGERVRQRTQAESRLALLRREVTALDERSGAMRRRLQAIDIELAESGASENERSAHAAATDAPAHGADAEATLAARRANLLAAIGAARETEQAADALHRQAVQAAHAAERSAAVLRERCAGLRAQQADALRPFGSAEHVAAQLDQARRAAASARAALEEFMSRHAERIERPKREHELALGREQALRDELSGTQAEIARHDALIRDAEADDLQTQQRAIAGQVQRAQARAAVLRRRLDGLHLLWRVVQAFQQQHTAALNEAVREVIGEWLAELTEQRWRGLQLSGDVLPTALIGGGPPLPLESASFGTAEQAALLLRLAIAWRLGEHERQLVVIDDRLVNADPVRNRRLGAILERVASRCQVLLATCDASRYAGLTARVIDLADKPRPAAQRALF